MTKWYKNPEIIKWLLLIIATIALGAFILTSQLVPDKYRLWLAILDYAVFTFANYKIIHLRNKDRQKAIQDSENRAARRQAERLKNK
ncbi:hypothetical protein Psch_01000 [Pelotomaculum schinkii]|uniref:Uncharacterized protein n=1 Tax=Pelotomaculum schinkii TaxID=78350 RepID=A0A4Y7RF66_9FIRM|nr:hypothetical protein [Pelotomaculum schinkii]TEB07446.1 hypothetical protein Psch_01000 [Pelotomaculum schinkii]